MPAILAAAVARVAPRDDRPDVWALMRTACGRQLRGSLLSGWVAARLPRPVEPASHVCPEVSPEAPESEPEAPPDAPDPPSG